MTLLDLLSSNGSLFRRVAATNGGEYAGPCPFCKGVDRFRVWPEHKGGRWWCRQCGRSGDLIQYLRDVKGMNFKEACQYTGRNLEASPPFPRCKKVTRAEWHPRETTQPNNLWQKRAKRLVKESEHFLWHPNTSSQKIMAWLREHRGLKEETIRAHRLGFIPAEQWEGNEQWGVPPILKENGVPKKIWIPRGLTIPLCRDDQVLRIRIRRPRSGGDPRYYLLRGSDTRAMILGHGREIHMVVEIELDAMLLCQEAGDLVGVVALGNAQTRPDKETNTILKNSRLILLALDADEAGAKEAWLWWQQTFSQAKRWPPVEGKDPGEMWVAGVDLKAWITAGSETYLGCEIKESSNGGSETDLEMMASTEVAAKDFGDLLELALSGRLREPIALPVLPEYQDILGRQIWVCPNGKTEEKTLGLSFSADELMVVLPRLKQDRSLAAIVIEAKRIFGGKICA